MHPDISIPDPVSHSFSSTRRFGTDFQGLIRREKSAASDAALGCGLPSEWEKNLQRRASPCLTRVGQGGVSFCPQEVKSVITSPCGPATPAEIRARDIDVRPDFKGLPKGQGSVKQGEVLWEVQCASCHGSFGESSNVFTPLAACLACHGMDNKLICPSFRDISAKYKDKPDAVNYLSGKIRAGGVGIWGAIPMPAQSLSPQDSAQLGAWAAEGSSAAKRPQRSIFHRLFSP